MSRVRGELDEPEEFLLGIERPSLEDEAVAARSMQEKLEVQRLFLIGLMENYLFREWLMAELQRLGTFDNSFGVGPAGVPDPMATQFQLGQKAAGWYLWCLFDDLAPELASKMRRGQ